MKMAADFDAVLASLYEAAVIRDLWPTALQQFAEFWGSRGALITRGDRNHQGLLYSPSLDATVSQFFEQDWHLNDYRTAKCMPLANIGFVTDQHIIDYDDIARSDYYSRFAKSAGVPWFATGGIKRSDGVALGVSLQRSEKEGAFSVAEMRKLNRILPRLREVLSLGYRMSTEQELSMLSGLDLIDQAAVVLDRSSKVCGMNEAASQLIDRLFTMSSHSLVTINPHKQSGLAQWLNMICNIDIGADGDRRVFTLDDVDGLPWLVQAMPVLGQASDVFGTGDIVLVFSPAFTTHSPSKFALAKAYGLTSAEARVAELIAAGLTTLETAERLAMTHNAVRFHMKSILPKANVHRQAAFVAAAAALPVLYQ